jgi:hypothetical protein
MLSASAVLDNLEAWTRDPSNPMKVNPHVRGICRIDAALVDGVIRWRTNGLTCSRQVAVAALEDARAAAMAGSR